MRRRSGFTIVELLVVMALIAVLALMAGPRISAARERSAMASARQQLTATLASARAAAIQKGQSSELRVAGGVVSVSVPSVSGTVQVVPATDYAAEYGVTLTLADDADALVVFDPRGFARLDDREPRFRLERGALKDSVCLTRLGQILPRECVR